MSKVRWLMGLLVSGLICWGLSTTVNAGEEVLFSETFDDLANWTTFVAYGTDFTIGVTSDWTGSVLSISGTGGAGAYVNNLVLPDDNFTFEHINTTWGASSIWIWQRTLFRYNPTANSYYAVSWCPGCNYIELGKLKGGTWTYLGGYTATGNTRALTPLTIQMKGSHIKVTASYGTAETMVIDVNDPSPLTGGTIGLMVEGSGNYGHVLFDNVLVTTTPNQPPVADIQASGDSQCGPITLDASGSSDPDGTIVSYLWSTGATTASINVTASGTYSVTVTDNGGATGNTSVQVVIKDTTAPVVTASIQRINRGSGASMEISYSAIDNCDGDITNSAVASVGVAVYNGQRLNISQGQGNNVLLKDVAGQVILTVTATDSSGNTGVAIAVAP